MLIAINDETLCVMVKHPNIETLLSYLDNHIDANCCYSIFKFDEKSNYLKLSLDNLKILLFNLTGISDNNDYNREQTTNLIIAYIGCFHESKSASWLQINATDEFTNYVASNGLQNCEFVPAKSRAFNSQQRQTTNGNAVTQGNTKTPKNGNCALIWEVANKLWELSKNIEQLSTIKKDARIELVAMGINPSTVSVQLSKWTKFIQNNC